MNQLAKLICGNESEDFRYRSGSYLTEFFQDCDIDYEHDGSTRSWWVAERLQEILALPWQNQFTPPELFSTVIRVLMDQSDAENEGPDRTAALAELNTNLARQGLEAFYGEDRLGYLRHSKSGLLARPISRPQRAFSKEELERRELLAGYIDQA